ncbi:MAG: hypothetical protein FWH11_04175 [Micrococcales bacterium]|nr:hypothetical protein [Micrococcales bacterium]
MKYPIWSGRRALGRSVRHPSDGGGTAAGLPAGPVGRGLLVVTVVALAVQVGLGLAWWVANVTAVPEYGDTQEYLRTATTFEVDGYRTLAYPLVVRAAIELGDLLPVPWVVPLYTVQLFVSVLANLVLVRALRPEARRAEQAAWTAVATTVPLPLHYTVTILTDSFATSTLLVLVAGLVRATVHQDRSWRAATLVAVGAGASVAVRPERLYMILALTAAAVLALGVCWWRRARQPRPARPVRVLVGLVLVALVPAGMMTAVNRATQTADLGRGQASVLSSVFDRTVNQHVDAVAARVPDEIAVALTTDPGNTNQTYAAVEAAAGQDGVRTAVGAAVRCCAAEIAAESVRDVAQGTLGPYTVTWYWVTGDGPSAQWDLSRMSQHRPGWTAVLMAWSVVTTGLLLVWTLVLAVRAGRRGLALPVLAVLAPAFLVGTFFGLVTSMAPNPRYTLVAQVVLWLLPLALLVAVDEGRDGTTGDAVSASGA